MYRFPLEERSAEMFSPQDACIDVCLCVNTMRKKVFVRGEDVCEESV